MDSNSRVGASSSTTRICSLMGSYFFNLSPKTQAERSSVMLLFDHQVLHPVARLRFADPECFAYSDQGWIGIPFFGIVFVNHIVLAIAVEQVDHVAFADREAEIVMQPSWL